MIGDSSDDAGDVIILPGSDKAGLIPEWIRKELESATPDESFDVVMKRDGTFQLRCYKDPTPPRKVREQCGVRV